MLTFLFIVSLFTIASFQVSAQENMPLLEETPQIAEEKQEAAQENEVKAQENEVKAQENEVKAQENKEKEETPAVEEKTTTAEKVAEETQEDLSDISAFEEELASDMEEKVAAWDVDDVEKLHQAGFNFNLKDFKQNPVLYYALSRNNSEDVIKKIVEYGADVNEFAANGMLPFNVVTSKANELQLQVLMMQTMGLDMSDPKVEEELKAKVFREMSRMLSIAAFLVDNGADVNKESVLGTPLMNAVTNKWNVEIINLLIKYGADVNKQDKNGRTALFYAFLSGNDEIVTQLIQYGADTEIKDNNGQTYLEVEKIN